MSLVEDHIKTLRKMGDGWTVEAGWFETARYPAGKSGGAGMSVAQVARINEFGATIKRETYTITIPARPFMRLAYTRIKAKKADLQTRIAKQMIRGKIGPLEALAQIGLFMEGEIVQSIKNGGWTPNAPSTVARKGFDKPLINTALMWQSVASKVSEPT